MVRLLSSTHRSKEGLEGWNAHSGFLPLLGRAKCTSCGEDVGGGGAQVRFPWSQGRWCRQAVYGSHAVRFGAVKPPVVQLRGTRNTRREDKGLPGLVLCPKKGSGGHSGTCLCTYTYC